MSHFILSRTNIVTTVLKVIILVVFSIFVLIASPPKASSKSLSNKVFLSRFSLNTAIYGITPTTKGFSQIPDLTRLVHTLVLVNNFYWIVVDDTYVLDKTVESLLNESGIKYYHIPLTRNPTHKPTKLDQLNVGLTYLKQMLKNNKLPPGVVIFMDDKSEYSKNIFDEIRKVKKIGVWPVGYKLSNEVKYPITIVQNHTLKVQRRKKINNTRSTSERIYFIEPFAFAINSKFLRILPEINPLQKNQLAKFAAKGDLEMLADNCTKVLAWRNA